MIGSLDLSLTQLLPLSPIRSGLCEGLLRPRLTPWRKAGTLVSVHETQMLLRRACELEGTFALVEQTRGHINGPNLAAAAQDLHHLTLKSAGLQSRASGLLLAGSQSWRETKALAGHMAKYGSEWLAVERTTDVPSPIWVMPSTARRACA